MRLASLRVSIASALAAAVLAAPGCDFMPDEPSPDFPQATLGESHLHSAIDVDEAGSFGVGRSTRYHQIAPAPNATALGIVMMHQAAADSPRLYFGQPTQATRTEVSAYSETNGGQGFLAYDSPFVAHDMGRYFHTTFSLTGLDSSERTTLAVHLPATPTLNLGASYELWMFWDVVTADRYEPNETLDLAAATQLPRDKDYGAGTYSVYGTITAADVDVFKLTIGEDDDIVGWLTFPHDFGDLTLELLNELGQSYGGPKNTSTSDHPIEKVLMDAPSMPAGTYFLRVKGATGTEEAGYHLFVYDEL